MTSPARPESSHTWCCAGVTQAGAQRPVRSFVSENRTAGSSTSRRARPHILFADTIRQHPRAQPFECEPEQPCGDRAARPTRTDEFCVDRFKAQRVEIVVQPRAVTRIPAAPARFPRLPTATERTVPSLVACSTVGLASAHYYESKPGLKEVRRSTSRALRPA
jgi:hypothetical protein